MQNTVDRVDKTILKTANEIFVKFYQTRTMNKVKRVYNNGYLIGYKFSYCIMYPHRNRDEKFLPEKNGQEKC